jgi:hypothetical protein
MGNSRMKKEEDLQVVLFDIPPEWEQEWSG